MHSIQLILVTILLSSSCLSPPVEGAPMLEQVADFFRELIFSGPNLDDDDVPEEVRKLTTEPDWAGALDAPATTPMPLEDEKKVLVFTNDKIQRVRETLMKQQQRTKRQLTVVNDTVASTLVNESKDVKKPVTKEEIKALIARIRSEFKDRRLETRTLMETLIEVLPEGFPAKVGMSALLGFQEFVRQLLTSVIQ